MASHTGERVPVEELAVRLMKIGAVAILETFLLTLDAVRAITVLLIIPCPGTMVLTPSTAVSATFPTLSETGSS